MTVRIGDSNMDIYLDESNIDECFLRLGHGEVYDAVVGNLEKMLIEKALERTGGNQLTAAKILGLNRNTIRAKIKKFGINIESYKR